MKRTVKITSFVLSAVLALSVFTGFSVDSKAATKQYHWVYGDTDFGEHPIFENKADVSNYIYENIIARKDSFPFYYADEAFNSDIIVDLVNNANTYRVDQSGAGDYLAKAYSGYSYRYNSFSNAYEGKNLFYINFTFTYYTTAEEEKTVDTKVDQIINSLNISSKSDLEKLTAIYNWITSNINYDYDSAALPIADRDGKTFTAYGALFKGKAVCQGIATLFYKMLIKTGIENRIVYFGNHCWNIVKINNRYYNCDVTWDLGVKPSDYTNFLRGKDTSFKQDHLNYYDKIFLGYNVSADDYDYSEPTTAEVKPSQQVIDFVRRFYTVVLERETDEEGLNYWAVELAANRMDGASVARMFINSDEFKAKKVSDSDYLRILYKTFFDREMDEDGKVYWLSVLKDGTTRENVLEGFINSGEWIAICKSFGIKSGASVASASSGSKVDGFAERLYTMALNRAADAEGMQYWSGALSSKAITGTEVARLFVFSDEFKASNVSNGEFINRLYRLFMDREADQGGFDYWMSRFASGASREDVFNGFSASDEFGEICESYGIAR